MEKFVDRKRLKHLVRKLKDSGKKVVFTNGCFDILHAGHVQYLRQAKTLGDILIVAINSDDSVRRLKPGRPIIPENQRVIVLSALEMVDYVTIFEEDTPYSLIAEIKPDIIVKGGDWKKEKIVGAELVEDVRSLCYLEGISTSQIIKKILQIYCP